MQSDTPDVLLEAIVIGSKNGKTGWDPRITQNYRGVLADLLLLGSRFCQHQEPARNRLRPKTAGEVVPPEVKVDPAYLN
jgi:hypothetical protein